MICGLEIQRINEKGGMCDKTQEARCKENKRSTFFHPKGQTFCCERERSQPSIGGCHRQGRTALLVDAMFANGER